MNIQHEVRQIVGEVLELNAESLEADASLIDHHGMDSVLAIDITTALEKKFKIRVPEDRMGDFESINSIVEVVEELLGQKTA